MSSSMHAGRTSRMDRVRFRVTKLMHLTRDADDGARAAPPLAPKAGLSAAEIRRISLHLSRLTDDLRALQAIVEDTEALIRRGWDVAVDLNRIRKRCRRCDEPGNSRKRSGPTRIC